MHDDEAEELPTEEEIKRAFSLKPWPGFEHYWPLVRHQQKHPQLYPNKPHEKVLRPQPQYVHLDITDSGKWRAKAYVKGKRIKTVGIFDTRDEAIDAALEYQEKLRGTL